MTDQVLSTTATGLSPLPDRNSDVVTPEAAIDGRLIWEEIAQEQRRKHWGAL